MPVRHPRGPEEGGECGGHPKTRGEGLGQRGTGPVSRPCLLGVPLPGPGSPGGQLLSAKWRCIQFGGGGSRHRVQPPPVPIRVASELPELGTGSCGKQGGGWKLVTWTVATRKGAGGRRPVPEARGQGGGPPVAPAWIRTAGRP